MLSRLTVDPRRESTQGPGDCLRFPYTGFKKSRGRSKGMAMNVVVRFDC